VAEVRLFLAPWQLQGMKTLLTEQQAAERLGVRPATLAVWRHRRVGPPFIQVGPRVPRYDADALEGWIAERAVRP
jgi:hypothetical protein